MYQFVDTQPTSDTGGTSLSLQTVFNGNNLDELLTDETGRFVTLSVGGRGILNRRLDLVQMPGAHGSRVKDVTYDIREIPVKFLIADDENEGLRERFNRLNGYIKGNEKRLEFTDENAHFIATLSGANIPDEDSNSLICTMTFICADSAKRMNEKVIEVGTSESIHTITGQDSAPWEISLRFTANTDKFELETDSGLYILLGFEFIEGDRLTIKYEGREVWLNDNRDLRHSIRLASNYTLLQPGSLVVKANHACELKYDERFN
ncbi:distal tail protein Dit [Oceanobacillus oncorhynchi]|uniref:distal tail protein Dit n=1 Tax=Oceanobacillus oncorhynchi TaxID=545501 RepID=UPI0025A414D6|nr:distal tail protein Dit [Oceanobacillus oncorhynchi]MDM8100931.1 phage tail family protein [Oceanobacillus oncorhynchi]